MGSPIISVSGLRGIVGESLTPEIAMRYAAAFSECIEPGPVVLTRDGRSTGAMLAHSLSAVLTALGRDVLDYDVAATPTTGILVREHFASGGIQISASHNPPEYNGLKLFSPFGRVVTADFGTRVLECYGRQAGGWVAYDKIGKVDGSHEDATDLHWKLISQIVDVQRIRDRRFRVLLDSNHGAGSLVGRRLLTELNCDFAVLGEVPDGRFEHIPEPTAENLVGVATEVASRSVDVAFCQDPDADRLALIDEAGRYVGEEYTLALCVAHVLKQTPGPVVTNCSTSRMTEDLAKKLDVPFFRSAVGEANVVDAMLREHAVIGGEGNGGVIDPRVVLVRDSFAAMAMILDSMAGSDLSVGQMVDALPRYHIEKTKVTLPGDRVSEAFDLLRRNFPDASVDRTDGLRLDWEDRWLLVRASNTEPIIRAVAESPSAEISETLCRDAGRILQSMSK